MPRKHFYITTTLPYVNAKPHIGFAMEIIRADIVARSKKIAGFEVFFNTGTDEHGAKIYRKAKEQNMDAQAFVDSYADKFKRLIPALNIMPEICFTRTTETHHVAAAREFWKIVKKNGFIYKKDYSIKYCVGCELEKTDSELVNGRCPVHPLQELEIIQEENYFFRFSAFQKQILELYERNPKLVIPDFRMNEIRSFVLRGLDDFSISRLASKMPWGIAVPDDDKHVMYVWFDALVSYISTIGWPDRAREFEKWWIDTGGGIQYCGKDNLRQQSAMWQAMLMAAGLPPSRTIVVDGFVTGEGGIKMSKSLGNTVDPMDIVEEYGADALRYYVAKELGPFEDSPFSAEKFKEAYNANLANGIGNLTSRIMKLAESHLNAGIVRVDDGPTSPINEKMKNFIESFDLQSAMNIIWKRVSELDEAIQRKQPFTLVKKDKMKGVKVIEDMVKELFRIAQLLEAFMPETSLKIKKLIIANKMPDLPLFVRQ